MQTRLQSLMEAWCNIAAGFVISLAVQQFIVTPFFHTGTSAHQNFWITVIFTVTSFARSYFLRRFFNWFHHRKATQ